MPKPPDAPLDAKFDVLLEALLFLVRHSPIPNLADALVADLHRTVSQDPDRRRVVEDLVYRLRERDEFIAENDA